MDLASYRKEQNWTLEDVARFVGLSNASAVHKHETGRVMPRAETLEAYRRLTGGKVTADDFARAVYRFRSSRQSKAA